VSSSPLFGRHAPVVPDRHRPTDSAIRRHPTAHHGMPRHCPARSGTARTQPDDPGFVAGSGRQEGDTVTLNGTIRTMPSAVGIRWHTLTPTGTRCPHNSGGYSPSYSWRRSVTYFPLLSLQRNASPGPAPTSRRAGANRRCHRGQSAHRRAVGRQGHQYRDSHARNRSREQPTADRRFGRRLSSKPMKRRQQRSLNNWTPLRTRTAPGTSIPIPLTNP